MDDYCTFTFDSGGGAGTYYIPCDRAGDLNEEGIVINGSNFNGYSSIYGSNYDKRIQFRTVAKPLYYSSYNSTATVITIENGRFNDLATYYRRFSDLNFSSIIVYLLLLNILVILLFRRR